MTAHPAAQSQAKDAQASTYACGPITPNSGKPNGPYRGPVLAMRQRKPRGHVITSPVRTTSDVERVLPFAYEDKLLMKLVIDALRTACGKDQRVIWRAPFRWMDDNGALCNCYEMFDLDRVASKAKLKIIHDFNHVAIVMDTTNKR